MMALYIENKHIRVCWSETTRATVNCLTVRTIFMKHKIKVIWIGYGQNVKMLPGNVVTKSDYSYAEIMTFIKGSAETK